MLGKTLDLKSTIAQLLAQPLTTDCYMVSRKWWDEMMEAVGKGEAFADPVNNLDLV